MAYKLGVSVAIYLGWQSLLSVNMILHHLCRSHDTDHYMSWFKLHPFCYEVYYRDDSVIHLALWKGSDYVPRYYILEEFHHFCRSEINPSRAVPLFCYLAPVTLVDVVLHLFPHSFPTVTLSPDLFEGSLPPQMSRYRMVM
jgi:hypothetical protein